MNWKEVTTWGQAREKYEQQQKRKELTTLVRDDDTGAGWGAALQVWVQEKYGNSPYLMLNFAMDQKLL